MFLALYNSVIILLMLEQQRQQLQLLHQPLGCYPYRLSPSFQRVITDFISQIQKNLRYAKYKIKIEATPLCL